MVRSRVPHVAHFILLGGARARVLILRALMLIYLISMRPDAHGGWHRGCAVQVCRVLGAYMRHIVSTPGHEVVHASVCSLQPLRQVAPNHLRRRCYGAPVPCRAHSYTRSTFYLFSTLKVLLGSLATNLRSLVMSQGGAVALGPFYIVPDGQSWPFDVSFDGDFTGMRHVQ